MALPEPGETDFGLAELTNHSYLDAIRSEMFKPEDFRLDRRPERPSWPRRYPAPPAACSR